jgi:hypothetical protein
MSQAESVPTTSRRRFLQGGAAASLAVPAVALPFADAELLAMEPVVADLWDRLGPVLDEVNRYEEAMREWRRQNPQPVIPEVDLSARPTFAELMKSIDAHSKECEADEQAYKAARAAWEKKEATAEWQAGKAASEERQTAFWDEQKRLVETLVATPATTLEGCRAKARWALLMDEEDLAWAIVQDLAGHDNEGGK